MFTDLSPMHYYNGDQTVYPNTITIPKDILGMETRFPSYSCWITNIKQNQAVFDSTIVNTLSAE